MGADDTLIFPDELEKHNDPSVAFFELANAPRIFYRLRRDPTNPADVLLCINQDSTAQTHTGGVVWETSYLLLGMLLEQQRHQLNQHSLGRLLEVGAGCGLLGIALAAAQAATNVTLSEVEQVLPLLQSNVRGNHTVLQHNASSTCPCRAVALDWTQFREDATAAGIEPHSIDTIVGTDVVFSPALVDPLWQTLRYLAHEQTVVYICVQIRCAVSHQMLLDKAALYGFVVTDITNQQREETGKRILPSWANDMECFLFRIQKGKLSEGSEPE